MRGGRGGPPPRPVGGRGGPRPGRARRPAAGPRRGASAHDRRPRRRPRRRRSHALATPGPSRPRLGRAGGAPRARRPRGRLVHAAADGTPARARASRLAGEGSPGLRAGRAGRDRRPPAGPALARAAAVGPAAAGPLPADRLRARGRGPLRVAHRQRGLGGRRLLGAAARRPRLAAPAPVRARGLRRSRDRREPVGARVRRHPGARGRRLRRPVGPAPSRTRGRRRHVERGGQPNRCSRPGSASHGWRVPGSRAGASWCASVSWRLRAPPDRSSRSRRRRPRRRVSTGRCPPSGSRPARAWSPAASS